MRRRFFLVTNPAAGIFGIPLVENVVAALQRRGAVVTRATADTLEATRFAVRSAADSGSCDAVIAAGGDGTIRQVAAALVGSGTPLGIIPVGTGNVLAHEIGLIADVAAVVRMLFDGPRVRVVCARANGEPFLLMTGAGFDARVLSAVDQRWKGRVGKIAYAGPLLGALAQPLDQLCVLLDGRSHSASWVVISNARHYAGRFVLAQRGGIERRGLVAVMFKANSRGALARQLMSLALGRLDARAARAGDVELVSCWKATITSGHPVPTQLDGDVFGTTPLHVDAGCSEIFLIVPFARICNPET
jgi:diacylglycerol kinase (ATP)